MRQSRFSQLTASVALFAALMLGSLPRAHAQQPAEQPRAPEPVQAEQPESPAQPVAPPRWLLSLTAGGAVRLAQNVDYGQSRLAPAHLSARGAYMFGGSGWLRHGVGLGLGFNLTQDGGFTEPLGVAQQWVISPGYQLQMLFGPHFFGLGRAALPIAVGVSNGPGLELAYGAAYRLLAGFGIYAELGLSAFLGAGSSVHPLLGFEAGLVLDYEVLP